MNKAPGLKIIIITFITLLLSIALYIIWYFQIEKITTQELKSIQNQLLNKNVNFTWEHEHKSGFPYRIEKELNNINIKFKNINLSTEKLKIIYQPWNKKHIIFLIPNNIAIKYNQESIIVNNSNLLASLIIDKLSHIKASIVSDEISLNFPRENYDFNKVEIYFKTSAEEQFKFAILLEKLSFPPLFIKKNIINTLYLDGKVIKYKKFDINNYYSWLSKEGGIDIKNFKLEFSDTNVNGNAFVSVDENYNFQNTLSIYSNNLNNVFSLLEQDNFISKNTLKKANLIINALEVASELSDKQATFSINIRSGYLYLMGIKLIKVPNLKSFL